MLPGDGESLSRSNRMHSVLSVGGEGGRGREELCNIIPYLVSRPSWGKVHGVVIAKKAKSQDMQ